MGGTIRLLMRLYQKIKGMGKRKSYYESAWAELDFYDSYWGRVYYNIPKVVEEGVPDYTKYGLTEEIIRDYCEKRYELGKKWSIGGKSIEDFMKMVLLCAFVPTLLILYYASGQVWLAYLITAITYPLIYFIVVKTYNHFRDGEYAAARNQRIEQYIDDVEQWREANRKKAKEAYYSEKPPLSNSSSLFRNLKK